MGQLQQYKDHFILFVEAGFIAVNQLDEDAALKLFRAAELLKPETTLPKVGVGYLHLCKLELKKACQCFEEVLAKEPNNDMAKTFLGLSLSLSPKELKKGEDMLEEMSKKSQDPGIKKLSQTAIDFVDRFVKKGGAPMQQKATKK